MSTSLQSQIFALLVDAYNGLKLSSGEILQSATFKSENVPRLLWKIGGWKSDTWTPYKTRIAWTVTAELKVQGESGSPYTALDTLADIYARTDDIFGLPVNSSGQLFPVITVDDVDAAEFSPIADRFVGPFIISATPRPGEADSTFTVVDLVITMEFVVDNTPDAPPATSFAVGGNLKVLDRGVASTDPNSTIASTTDTRTEEAFAKPDTTLVYNGDVVQGGFPPLVQDIPSTDGVDPTTTVISVEIAPASVTVTSTQQLVCFANYLDRSSKPKTTGVTWQSSDASVATVSSTGLVTKVSNGSAVITATFSSISGTCAVTTA